jgi:hypothetical protein
MPGLFSLHSNWAAGAYSAALIWVNAYICRGLFFAEYTGYTNSLQGLWIAMARLGGGRWLWPAWWPYQDGGTPFEHLYMPLAPAATALYAITGGVSEARAFNALTGIVYCAGPVALFLMAWRMTGAAGYSFIAALAFSLTSPARALIPDPYFDPAFLWTSRRLYTTVVWDDTPHQLSLCFVMPAMLFLWRSLTRRRRPDYLIAWIFVVLSALASVFGVVTIALGSVCLLAALPRKEFFANARRIALIGIAAYLAVCPFLPPSLIAIIRRNQQMFPEDQWSPGSLYALAAAAAGFLLVWGISSRWIGDRATRFFLLFGFLFSAIPMMEAYWRKHFLPQAGRYQPEMEIGLALAVVFGIRPAMERLPRVARALAAVALLYLAAQQVIAHRRYAKETIAPVDITRKIEYRVAKWMEANFPGQRVMVPGSIAQWFNAFTDTPQLSGGSYSTTLNWTQQEAMVHILSAPAADAARSVLWLRAFGIQAVAVAGPRSPEFWKPYTDPLKFEGRLPVLWREDDVTIYRVPQKSALLAHVVPAAAGRGELSQYADSLEPVESFEFDGFRRGRIRASVPAGRLISVQTAYHPGWTARANGREAAVHAGGLGFLLIDPRCDGRCEIELAYDGGWEYKLCRALSLLAITATIGFLARRRADAVS